MTSWRVAQSAVVGGGKARHGCLFRALVPVQCDWCAGTIRPGDTFTRSGRGPLQQAQTGRLLRNVCRRCSPGGPPGTQEAAHGG